MSCAAGIDVIVITIAAVEVETPMMVGAAKELQLPDLEGNLHRRLRRKEQLESALVTDQFPIFHLRAMGELVVLFSGV